MGKMITKWSDELSVGIEMIDGDHQRLMALAEDIESALVSGAQLPVVIKRMRALLDETSAHFLREEDLMVGYHYERFDIHKKEHDDLLQKMARLIEDVVAGHDKVSNHTISFLNDWLVRHIVHSDRLLSSFLTAE